MDPWPHVAAKKLHEWVWSAAASLYDDGHYRQAVESAAVMVDNHLKAKLDRVDASGSDLVTQAFSIKPSEPGHPRLRFKQFDPASDDWRSAHEGAMHFGRGCMMGIRNLAAHRSDELLEAVAIEQLAALSVLARWIDEAVVERS